MPSFDLEIIIPINNYLAKRDFIDDINDHDLRDNGE